MMRRVSLLATVVPLILVTMAQPASAKLGPPIPWQGQYTTDVCGFDVKMDLGGKYTFLEWTDADGVYHYKSTNPGSYAIYTVVETGEVMRFPNNGLIMFSLEPNGDWHWTLRGPSAWGGSPLNDDEPGLWLTTGRVDHWGTHFMENGFTVNYRIIGGRMIDLCPVLAP